MQDNFLNLQSELRKRINCNDTFNVSEISTIVGVDLAYWNGENNEE